MVEDDSTIVLNTKLAVLAAETRILATATTSIAPASVPGMITIYANHQRIWLGTFKSEREAAMAYDSAAIKIRSGDTHRNLPWTDLNVKEPDFQSLYSTEEVLNMIRDEGINTSDVGKLNRLVIPKKYAVKHFPRICETDQQSPVGGVEDIELVFYDNLMMTWKFRYCYWRSSQSFVFTRGWSRFVKEKKLGEKDTVTFYACECPGGSQNGRSFFLIDVDYNGESGCIDEGDKKRTEASAVELELNLGKKNYTKTSSTELNEDRAVDGLESGRNVKEKSITLFGVQIN
ncbi:Detected protein of unknown function [Hibiscus syriacus]|uniref:AP2/ERF and B3 domain-containing transcription factor n=1 Tax=Hibiscus syriacus TaxID=106335 RepID=A0A6A2YDA0_HIBSY|nr:Detected protein of unknown function [Hibiscus syriacus]